MEEKERGRGEDGAESERDVRGRRVEEDVGGAGAPPAWPGPAGRLPCARGQCSRATLARGEPCVCLRRGNLDSPQTAGFFRGALRKATGGLRSCGVFANAPGGWGMPRLGDRSVGNSHALLESVCACVRGS